MLQIIFYAFLGGLFTFIFTVLGAGIVFFFKTIHQDSMDSLLSFSAGIMLSAAFFSLLNPAIELCNQIQQNVILVIFGGLLCGGLFIISCNHLLHHFSSSNQNLLSFKRCLLLITSITLHNIPEGLAVGVAFGTMLYGGSLISALSLTLGIAIQNFPEGSAISLPLRRDGFHRSYAFLCGCLSGLVEPVCAILGALLVLKIKIILPFVLSFAAGAMLYVTVLELIPESQKNKKKDLMAFILLLGFSIMMLMELLLG